MSEAFKESFFDNLIPKLEDLYGSALSAAHAIMKSRSEEDKTEWKRFNINSYLAERAYSDIEDIEK